MRPVVPEEVGDLLKSRPVMIFNRTLLGPAYIECIVSSSPALVTSQGGKALPLEVWDMIIDFSNRCPENHRYSLVRPKRLQTSARGDELVCDMYKRWWWPFGNTYCLKGIEMLRFYLAHPDEPSESDHPDLNSIRLNSFYYSFPRSVESPFAISSLFPFDGYFDLSEYLDFFDKYVSSCTFPTALLASKTKFLHVDLTVSDVIKNLEDGNCECCHGKHVIGTDFEGRCGSDWSMFWRLLDKPTSYYLTGFFICPLCVGPEYARESIDVHASTCVKEYHRCESPTKCKDPTQGPKATGFMFCTTSLSQKKYKSWLLDRVESLGFKRPRWEDIPHSMERLLQANLKH